MAGAENPALAAVKNMAPNQLEGDLKELAALAGLDRPYVGGIERGERNVAVINIVKIARALALHPENLLRNLD